MEHTLSERFAHKRQESLKDIAFELMTAFVSTTDIDHAVNTCIERIGQFCNAGRAYVFRFRTRGSVMDNTHEWCAPGVESEMKNLQGLKTDAFPWWMAKLRAGHHIHITSLDDLPPEAAAERTILEPQGIRSLLVLPFSEGGGLGGYVGFDNVRNTGAWSERDFQLLKTSADIIGNALERQKRYRELVAARDAAEQAAHGRARFADYVAHEIRTPLSSIVAMVEALEESECSPGMRESVALIKEGASVLTSIIDQTLDFSRAQAGRITLESVPFGFAQAVTSRVEMYRQAAARKGLALHLRIDSSSRCSVVGDPRRLGQILGNLLANAIKFTDAGEVMVEAGCEAIDDDRIVAGISVADTGPGIKPETIPLLFERFTQESAATARNYGGSGLGLAICKLLTEQMGGAIDVQSTPGGGSRFSVTVQLKPSGGKEPHDD